MITELTSGGENAHKMALHMLDLADLIVPMISKHFIDNIDLIAMLQVAINRQRGSDGKNHCLSQYIDK